MGRDMATKRRLTQQHMDALAKERHIGPMPPRDGNEWDCQCARCGSSAEWYDCEECDDGFVEEDWGDDVVPEMHDVPCEFCGGYGGYYRCLSSPEWCQANPLTCREWVKRGQIEWSLIRASEDNDG